LSAKIHLASVKEFGQQPPGGEPLEARVAKLEAHVEHIREDTAEIKTTLSKLGDRMWTQFIITWGGLIAVAVGLTGVMAKGFGWL